MKKVRLIALDLDGTLLDDRKEVPRENLEALRRARELGVVVAIASGRMTARIEPIEEALGLDCVLIAYNGAKVVGPRSRGRPTIHHRPLAAEVARFFIELSRRTGHLLNFYLDERLYAEDGAGRRPFMDLYSRRTGAEYHLTDLSRFAGDKPTKLIILAEPAERDRLHDRLASELRGEASLSKSEPEYLEIMAPGVSKGAALPALASYYGLSTDEILAVGDATNDLSMIEVAGIGVALANASEDLRRAADWVSGRTNNEGGVAEAVRRFVLEGST